ncbi:MAG: hypothetical protein R3C25_01720 [Hyphomonadaceae bacterium]
MLLSAQGDSLKLTATDLDIEISGSAAGWSAAARRQQPANYLYDFVRKLPDGAAVKLDVSGDDLSASSSRRGKSRLHLPITLPAGGTIDALRRIRNPLRDRAHRTRPPDRQDALFAISRRTRYYLNGIFFHTVDADGPKLRAVAADGHRLALADYTAPKGAEGMPEGR